MDKICLYILHVHVLLFIAVCNDVFFKVVRISNWWFVGVVDAAFIFLLTFFFSFVVRKLGYEKKSLLFCRKVSGFVVIGFFLFVCLLVFYLSLYHFLKSKTNCIDHGWNTFLNVYFLVMGLSHSFVKRILF